MVHEAHNTDLAAMRKRHPGAAIIRRLGPGHYVAFDQPSDALGHPSADRQPSQPTRVLP